MMRSFLLLAVISVLAACQTTQGKIESIPQQGTVFYDEYPTANGRAVVPLPEGKWIVAGASYTRLEYDNPFEEVVLISQSDEGSVSLIEITSSISVPRYGWGRSTMCERDDMYFLDRRTNAKGGIQDCWGLQVINTDLSGDLPAYLKQASQYANQNNIPLGFDANAVSYNFADRGYFLRVSHLSEPNVADMDTLKRLGKEWYPKVKAGFEGKPVLLN